MADFDVFDVFDEATDDSKEVKDEVAETPTSATNSNDQKPAKRQLDENEVLAEDSKKFKSETDEILSGINLEEVAPRIEVYTVETLEACTHEVAFPPGIPYTSLVLPNGPPAKEYPFILDPFQKEAILCIDNNQSVLVSAHTSAGKTVVAEYAIAASLRDKQRVIYTTPIKALSNQKYREFFEEFKDVGLITGDVTINPSASCLIMTTEILRNMLYRGSEVMREVGWVIFDEIHYMRDKERGVVWEETIILLPDNVHNVFLSATIPNARQFVEWIAHLHKQPCHVVYTDYRPTPLQHYLFPNGGDGIHLVVDESGKFREDNFNSAMTVLANAGDNAKGGDHRAGRKGGPRNGQETNCYKIVKMIMERSFAPVIVFSFSKKDCEVYAMQMAKLDFNTSDEKKLVDEVFNNAMDVLNDQDRKLPQVENVLPLLRRGIGIHHGGLLPILKETIEILFSEGLIKALFATETFAMGLNMPARTVLFTASQKFDGKEMRSITSGEYIQMSGRAGRRGLDDKGIVILMVDEKVSPENGKALLQGSADPINSAFHLTYNMVLNLLRVEEINPEYMLERSFFQFQNNSSIPVLYEKVQKKQKEVDAIVIANETQIASYYNIREQLDHLSKVLQTYVVNPVYLTPFLQPGRLVKIKTETEEYEWGIIINFRKEDSGQNPALSSMTLIVDVLLHVAVDKEGKTERRPCPPGEQGEMEVVPVLHKVISQISSLRIHYPKDLRPPDNRKSVLKSIREVKKRFNGDIPLLNPVTDMHIKEESFLDLVKRIQSYEQRLFDHPLHDKPQLETMYNAYRLKTETLSELKMLRQELKRTMSLVQMEELKCRKRVLRRLKFCNASDIIETKGRIACELSSGEELLMTEMMFNGMFNDLDVPQCVAILSCFVCDEKSNEVPKRSAELSGLLRQMQEMARRIAKVTVECKIPVDVEKYVEQFKPFLMDVCYAWCKGASFIDVLQMTDIFEGSIIRAMRRLEEILRQLVQAAKGIGNTDLENKFSEGIRLIKRDIVFAASLYL
ncbi:unnamed protein product [Bemisia tabaci]|uniref:Superkiller viralicidic activity 2-like 2 n=1 Tax=Bemisia tabaci TaxID=7038 RepID=A0A9P0F5Z9_BEMTA|nr:PREDICTED: superkiller viralicidic activity 2-like 2 [Bemisia tabaci]CAH0390444.1 unnamed protein product [Bemisia tabaci]